MFSDVNLWLIIISATLLAAVIVLLITLAIALSDRKKLKKVLRNCSSGRLDDAMNLYYSKVDRLMKEFEKKDAEFQKTRDIMTSGIVKFAAVRYDAFGDISNNLSFSLALLDKNNTGYIISSIQSREVCNVYIKSVSRGRFLHSMSEEETRAYNNAVENYEIEQKSKETGDTL